MHAEEPALSRHDDSGPKIVITSFLPPELLGDIFILAALNKCRMPHIIPLEVTLSHVCRHWRTVALGTPSLWTRIELYSLASMLWIPSYLERSSGCLLSIRLDLHRSDMKLSSVSSRLSMVTHLTNEIIPHIHRCRCLLIFTYHELTAYDVVSQFSQLSAPNLERLRVSVDCVTSVLDSSVDLSSVIFSGGVPRLSFLENEALHMMPPLTNITTLHLHRIFAKAPMSYERLLHIAAAAPSLANLSMRGAMKTSTWPYHVAAPAFEMRALRAVLFDHGPLAIKFLLSVAAPKLETLWLECSFSSFPLLFESPQFQQGSKFPLLRYLTLQWYDIGNNVSAFSLAFPRITHLHLAYPGLFHVKFFEEALTSSIPPIWEQLNTIVIRTTRESEQHGQRLVEALLRIFPTRRHLSLPICTLLADSDLLHYLETRSGGALRELVDAKILNTSNYEEPWWIMSHQHFPDSASLCNHST